MLHSLFMQCNRGVLYSLHPQSPHHHNPAPSLPPAFSFQSYSGKWSPFFPSGERCVPRFSITDLRVTGRDTAVRATALTCTGKTREVAFRLQSRGLTASRYMGFVHSNRICVSCPHRQMCSIDKKYSHLNYMPGFTHRVLGWYWGHFCMLNWSVACKQMIVSTPSAWGQMRWRSCSSSCMGPFWICPLEPVRGTVCEQTGCPKLEHSSRKQTDLYFVPPLL